MLESHDPVLLASGRVAGAQAIPAAKGMKWTAQAPIPELVKALEQFFPGVDPKAMAAAADDPAKPPMVGPSFWKTSQLYELCTSQHQTDRAHCEGFITGVASTLQNEQISRVRVCIPKGATS